MNWDYQGRLTEGSMSMCVRDLKEKKWTKLHHLLCNDVNLEEMKRRLGDGVKLEVVDGDEPGYKIVEANRR